jgi:uncharacterized delta-60 repeat protein
MKKNFINPFFVIAISLTVLASVAAAQTQLPAGSLDQSFGSAGKLALRHEYDAKLSSVAVQSDGKIVVAGAIGLIAYKVLFVVARYNSDGTPDQGFGSNGMVITRFESSTNSASAIAIQPDGKIVVTGQLGGLQPNGVYLRDFVVLRLNSDGSPDSGFGKNGEVTTDFAGAMDSSKALVLQADGKIVVGGSKSTSPYDLELARYNADGSLDKTFNSTGMVITPYSNDANSFNAMALQSDGKIVVASSKYNNNDPDGLLIRYNSDGSIDQGFGVDGRVISDFGGFDYIRIVQVQNDGNIFVVGSRRPEWFSNESDLFLARYNRDGSPDQSFGSSGKLIASFNKYADVYSAVLQSDGKLLIAGTSGPGNPNYSYSLLDFLAVRYNADGTLDKDFGDGGKVLTDFGRLERARAAAVDAKGNIVLAGYTGDYTWDGFDQADFALARYIGVTPKPSPDFALTTESTTVTASRGSKVKLTININRLNGFDSNVTVNAPDTSNLKIIIPEPTVTASGASANFTLKTKKGTPTGTHQLVFTGKDDTGHERSLTITLAIQ